MLSVAVSPRILIVQNVVGFLLTDSFLLKYASDLEASEQVCSQTVTTSHEDFMDAFFPAINDKWGCHLY